MVDRPFNVLFLCTGNSARSIRPRPFSTSWAQQIPRHSASSQPKAGSIRTRFSCCKVSATTRRASAQVVA